MQYMRVLKILFSFFLFQKGSTNGILLALKYMSKDTNGKGGVIVNTASVAGLHGVPPFPMYTASKHAIVGLTRSFGVSKINHMP